jgi:hypothetical protein
MNDMSQVIIPKSDQINTDDFMSGPRTYTIERVTITPGTEQPVSIKLSNEDRTWRPCKSMSRCLVGVWGPDAKNYVGRSVTLYRDPKVKWGGMEVGGIRISHLSHMEREMVMSLTETKGKRAPHMVKPLKIETPQSAKPPTMAEWVAELERDLNAATTDTEVGVIASRDDVRKVLQSDKPKAIERVNALVKSALDRVLATDGRDRLINELAPIDDSDIPL